MTGWNNERKQLMKNRKIINRTIMIYIIAIVLTVVMTVVFSRETKALDTCSPTYTTYNYDNYMSYSERYGIQGCVTYTKYVDLTNMNTLRIPYAMNVRKCCDNTDIEEAVYVAVRINGITVYYNDAFEINESVSMAGYVEPVVNIESYRDRNAKVEYEIHCGTVHCRNCGQQTEGSCLVRGLFFADLRPKADIRHTSVSLKSGENFTYSPSCSDNTVRVSWGIRYSGNGGFLILNDGVLESGLTISGATTKNLTISNVPYMENGFDIGLFVYDKDGNLPGGTEFPNTPFVSHVSIKDGVKPSIGVKKTLDTANKCVVVEISGTDNVSLHAQPYSFDGGASYSGNNKKAFTEAGKIVAVVRDSSGNTAEKAIYIDSIEIESVNPKSGGGDGIKEKETGTGSGGGGSDGENTGGQSPGTTPGVGKKTGETPGSGSFDENKDPDTETTKNKSVTDPLKTKDTASIINTPSDKNNKSKNTSDLKQSDLSDADAQDAFERIRNNSEKYIIKMRESKSSEKNMASADETEADLSIIDESAPDYSDGGNEKTDSYVPDSDKRVGLYIGICCGAAALIASLLAFILFFGVIIFADRETELTMISEIDGVRLPVAIGFVNIMNKDRSVNIRELLNKYGYVYARFGVLFTYLYEGERIKIMTKAKGEKKKEIATEIIHKEIIIGNKGGGRK